MEKVSLPIKTKIAAWWIRITGVGLLVLAFPVAQSFGVCPACASAALMILLTFILLGLIFLILSFFLLKRKKLAWWSSIVILSLGFSLGFIVSIIYPIDLYTIISLIAIIVPLILLFLDRKNFWKIAS